MNPHVDLQVVAPFEALLAVVTPVGLLAGVGTLVDSHLGIAPSVVQALGHAVVNGRRAESLQIRRGDEGLLIVHHQLPPPFSASQDPQLPVGTGCVGGARGVRMQTIRGGDVLCAAVFNVITVFCREENNDRK